MPPITLTVDVDTTPVRLFAALTDPRRLERWLYGTDEIAELSGSLAVPGTTFVQRAAGRIQRPGGVVAAERPHHWHIRLVGMGERADLAFDLRAAERGTVLSLTADVRNGPRIIGPLVDRLGSGLERRLWSRVLERVREDMAWESVEPAVGDVYVLEGGGWLRIGDVLEHDNEYVHLRLRAGTCDAIPDGLDDLRLVARVPKDHHAIRPLDLRMRAAASLHQVGAAAMLADGGFGLDHCPLTITEFRNARPRFLGRLPPDLEAARRVAWWRDGRAHAFGEQRPPRVGAFFTVALQGMGLDAMGFGLVKLLDQGFRGVHLRTYSNVFVERPTAVDPGALEERPADLARVQEGRPFTEPPASPHVALSHRTFTAAVPVFVSTVLVDADELIPIESWKLGRGTFI